MLYKGWIRPKIEYASEVYGTFAKTHAVTLERVQALCLRNILGASKSTPHVILQNEASVSSLASRRRQQCILTFAKIMSLPRSHVLQQTLRHWWRRDIGFEGLMLRPRTFFGQAYHSHNDVFGCPPSKELAFEFMNPISLPPWSVFYTPPRKIDIHQQFRRCLREKVRNLQLQELRNKHSASWYNSMHPQTRRIWLRCLPPGGVYLRIIARLRSGYTTVGGMLPYMPEVRCPDCGAVDSVEHLLCSCVAHFERRSKLYDEIGNFTTEPLTLSLLLGFSLSLDSKLLRRITIATARFVIDCKRWP